MAQAPYMPVFTDALLGDTSHLNSEQFGSYCRILFATWRNNGVPFADDDKTLACICHMGLKRWRERIRNALAAFFDLSDGRWRQKRLEKEWRFVQKKCAQRRAAGNASAQAKRLKTPDTESTHVGTTRVTNGSTTQLHSSKEDSEDPNGSPVADATPPPPDERRPDPVRELWDRGLCVLGQSSRSLIGKARKQHGDLVVMEALLATEAECASHPVEFFVGCLRCHARTSGSGYASRIAPITTFYEAANNVWLASLERDRSQGNPDIDHPADEPLLAGYGGRAGASGAARRLA